jgi:hypothetical protein
MIEAKPVAYICYKAVPDGTWYPVLSIRKILGTNHINHSGLFTESQLKAEVERVIKQCADICVDNSKEFNDPFQSVRASHRILALLVNQGASLSSIDTDERKEK